MRMYGTVPDLFPSERCAPTDRACLHREHYAQKPPLLPPLTPPVLPAYDCPPNARCVPPGWTPREPVEEKPPEEKREALITTAGVTDQWWFFPAVVLGVVLLMRRD